MLLFPADMLSPWESIIRMADEFSVDDCVFLTCFSFEFEFVAAVLRYSGVRFHRAETLEQADFLLIVTGARVLLCDAVFLDGCWVDCADMLRHVHPGVSLIVVAAEVDRPYVAGATTDHASQVFWKPLRVNELRQIVREVRQAAATARH